MIGTLRYAVRGLGVAVVLRALRLDPWHAAAFVFGSVLVSATMEEWCNE